MPARRTTAVADADRAERHRGFQRLSDALNVAQPPGSRRARTLTNTAC